MRRLNNTLAELTADNYRWTLRCPRDRDLRDDALVKSFAKANREQISRNAERERRKAAAAAAANEPAAPPIASNVVRFGGAQ